MNGYLFDTNVLSETRRPVPNQKVLDFVGTLTSETFYTSAIAIAELRVGALRKSLINPDEGKRISRWIDGVERRMRGRILVVDTEVAAIYAKMQQKRDRPIMDALLAATAIAHGLTMVTRNVRDFVHMEVEILNPWEWGPP